MHLIHRVGLIGDLHAEDEALEFALGELERLGVEAVLQAGDIADGAGDLDRAVQVLQRHGVLAVRGNHDRWLLDGQLRDLPLAHALPALAPETIDYLKQLPVTRVFSTPRGDVLLCHGLDQNDMVGVKPQHEGYDISSNSELERLIRERRFRFVLNGHTHRSMLRSFGSLSIINAGTLLRDAERCFMVVDFERGELLRYRHAAGALQRDLRQWVFERLVLADSSSGS